jgi:hypothetical protein
VKKKKCEKKIIIENLRIGVKTNEIIIQRRKKNRLLKIIKISAASFPQLDVVKIVRARKRERKFSLKKCYFYAFFTFCCFSQTLLKEEKRKKKRKIIEEIKVRKVILFFEGQTVVKYFR